MNLFMMALRRTIGNMVGAMIPLHLKRILFIMSVYRHLAKLKKFDLAELDELDHELKLTTTGAKALVVPGVLGGLFWKIVPNESNDTLTISQILRSSPCWLKYGRREDIEQDFKMLNEFIANHQHA
jgi:hypothetical protein